MPDHVLVKDACRPKVLAWKTGGNLRTEINFWPADELTPSDLTSSSTVIRISTCLCCFDDVCVRQVKDVDPVDSEDDVTDFEAGSLGRSPRLDSWHNDRPRAVDPEAELSCHAQHTHVLVALWEIIEVQGYSKSLQLFIVKPLLL